MCLHVDKVLSCVIHVLIKYGIPGPEGIRKSSGRGKEITGSIGQSTERRR